MAAVAQQVEQPAGAGDDDIGAAPQCLHLRVLAHAAVDGRAAHVRVLAQGDGGLVDLFGQFARRHDDQRAHLARRACAQALQDGQHEGRGLAGAGLRQAQHVALLQHNRDGLLLDGGGGGVTRRF